MFTQFFGSYLLNQKLVTPKQLGEALEAQKTTHLKLGVRAINAGFMNAEQVDEIHSLQAKMDKRIGDIAVEMGYMTRDQVEELLKDQKVGYLLLGQVLVDKGYMSNSQFEKALNHYKKETEMKNIVKNFYHFDGIEDAALYSDYVALLFRNIVRFIGDDFTPMQPSQVTECEGECLAIQEITGDYNFKVAIKGSREMFVKFAARFSEEECSEDINYVKEAVGEFLNLQNGLFCVNVSNGYDKELDLMPQVIEEKAALILEGISYLIPVYFPFGIVHIIIGKFSI